jgi:hypothetical protein
MPALPDYCYGNARYVAAHCRGVIILISRSAYSPARYFYPPSLSSGRSTKTRPKIARTQKKGSPFGPPFLLIWSGRRVSNSRPQPWQGCALPTELLPHCLLLAGASDRPFMVPCSCPSEDHRTESGAGEESRTLDLNLGKVALYQLSYSRISTSHTDPACNFLTRKKKKPVRPLSSKTWSGRRVSNSRPQPWQGCALPTELLPRHWRSQHYKDLKFSVKVHFSACTFSFRRLLESAARPCAGNRTSTIP